MSLSVSDADVGRQGKCSRCGTVFTIEAPQAAHPYRAPAPAAIAAAADVTPGVVRVGEGISRGFSVLHANLGVFILMALCFLGISFAIGLAGYIPCLGALIALANGFVIQPAMVCGFYRASLKQYDGYSAEVGDLFVEFSQWIDILLVSLCNLALTMLALIPAMLVGGISLIPIIIASINGEPLPEPNVPIIGAAVVLAFFGVILVNLALLYVFPALVDQRRGCVESIKTSWQLMTSNPLGSLGAVLLAGVIIFAGFLVCCVGLLYSMPAVHCLFAAIYRTALPPRNWAVAGAPPSWPASPPTPIPPNPPEAPMS